MVFLWTVWDVLMWLFTADETYNKTMIKTIVSDMTQKRQQKRIALVYRLGIDRP